MSWRDLFKSKSYPDFWKYYLKTFKAKTNAPYIAFDCETTGLDPKSDRILSIGAVKFTTERIFIKESKEWFVKQQQKDTESIKIHGILPSSSEDATYSEENAIKQFLSFIGNSTLVGHHINFDVTMVNLALKRLGGGKLKNSTRDTNILYKKKGHFAHEQNFSLDRLCEVFQIRSSNRHTALGDAYITARVYQKLMR
jgi:DNA polymerase-3 subunit epsilon